MKTIYDFTTITNRTATTDEGITVEVGQNYFDNRRNDIFEVVTISDCGNFAVKKYRKKDETENSNIRDITYHVHHKQYGLWVYA